MCQSDERQQEIEKSVTDQEQRYLKYMCKNNNYNIIDMCLQLLSIFKFNVIYYDYKSDVNECGDGFVEKLGHHAIPHT